MLASKYNDCHQSPETSRSLTQFEGETSSWKLPGVFSPGVVSGVGHGVGGSADRS